MTSNVVCIIPARGGSKGVPHKNRRLVAGLPLIAYTIRAARSANAPQTVLVSTDDPEIATIARQEGVQAIMRPPAYAADDSPVIDAVRHALAEQRAAGGAEPDAVVLLQPTSPFRSPGDIDAAVELFLAQERTPVCSVYQAEDAHPARMYRIAENRLRPLMPELAEVRRQDLPPVYHRNGAIYVFGQRELTAGRIIADTMVPYVMALESSVNVDTELDLLLVNALLEQRHANPDL